LEYTPSGTLVNTIAVPSTGPLSLTLRGNAISEGVLNFSADGTFALFGGYRTDVGTSNPQNQTAAAVNRVFGTLNTTTSAVNTTVSVTDGWSGPGAVFRSVASTNGLTSFYGSGDAIATTGSVRYVGTPSTATTSTPLSAGGNTSQIQVLNGNLFASAITATSPGASVHQVGTGLPTSGTQTFSPSIPLNTTTPSSYFFTRLGGVSNPTWNTTGFDTLYTIDATTTSLQKYTFNGTAWGLTGSIPSGALLNLAGVNVGGSVNFFASSPTTSAGSVQRFTDTSGYNNPMAGAFANLPTAIASGNSFAFRGIGVVPVPEPATILGLSFGVLAVVGWRRSRRGGKR
jgi:hypothetical protein